MSVIGSNILAGASGQAADEPVYIIQRSLRIEKTALDHDVKVDFERTFDDGNRRTWALSIWLKRSMLSIANCNIVEARANDYSTTISFTAQNTLKIENRFGASSSFSIETNTIFVDPHAWYHLVICLDTTEATPIDRLRIYVNGHQLVESNYASFGFPSLNDESYLNSADSHEFGNGFSGYMTDVQFISGATGLTAESFGHFIGPVWHPISYAGSYNIIPAVNSYPAVFTSSQDGSGSVSDVTSNSGLFRSGNLSGQGSIRVEFSPALEDIVAVRFRGGAYSDNGVEQYDLIVNDSVLERLATLSGHPTVTKTITKQDITSFEISSVNDGWALGDLEVSTNGSTFNSPPGTPTLFPSRGANGFHLNFANNSNLLTLGLDVSGNDNDFDVNGVLPIPNDGLYNPDSGDDATIDNILKIFDPSFSTYGVMNGPYLGFSYVGKQVKMELANPTSASLTFRLQPYVNGAPSNNGSWKEQTVGTVSGNNWTLPANSQGTALFDFPGGYNNFGRFGQTAADYSSIRIYYIVAGPEDKIDVDSVIDTPTNYVTALGESAGNYATFSPLIVHKSGSTSLLDNGNRRLSGSTGDYIECKSTIDVFSVPHYCELVISTGTDPNVGFGIGDVDAKIKDNTEANGSYISYQQDGKIISYDNGTTTVIANVSGYSNNDILGMTVDATEIQFYRNTLLQGTWAHGRSGVFYTHVLLDPTDTDQYVVINYGASPFLLVNFKGYGELCSQTLPAPPIPDRKDFFDIQLYEGNGTSQSITGYEFSPSFVWIKSRNRSRNFVMSDIVRGAGRSVACNSQTKEAINAQQVTSFDANGFSVGNNNNVNGGSVPDEYLAWAWNGGTVTESNGDGFTGSTIRRSPTSGFSIVKYIGLGTASTVGHGLGVTPDFVLVKNLTDDNAEFVCNFREFTDREDEYFRLTERSGPKVEAGFWNNGFNASTFGIGTDNRVNGFSKDYIAYCISSVSQYCTTGRYTGNDQDDGPRVNTGFRPGWLLIKRGTANGNWVVLDTRRDPDVGYNAAVNLDSSTGEYTYRSVDFLSTGFKIVTDDARVNEYDAPYFYLAIADMPFSTNGGIAR